MPSLSRYADGGGVSTTRYFEERDGETIHNAIPDRGFHEEDQ